MDEQVEKIRKKVSENSLRISRIPPNAKKRFVQLAAEEFVGDYGMTLKYILDVCEGIISPPEEQLEARMNLFTEQINYLKDKIEKLENKSERKEIRTLSGKIIKRKGGREK